MICDDAELNGTLDDALERLLARDPEVTAAVVRRCVSLKGTVVAADEREAGVRAVLNYGHTVGHAIEAAGGYAEGLNHGEAVAVGMRVAGLLSVRRLGCSPGDIAWQNQMLTRSGLGVVPRMDVGSIISRLSSDKKVTGDTLHWVLLAGRGAPRFGQVVPQRDVVAAIGEVMAE
jgi:3-dehydroquinate synthase